MTDNNPFGANVSEIPREGDTPADIEEEDIQVEEQDNGPSDGDPTDFAILDPLLTHIVEEILDLPPSSIFYNQNEV